MRPASLPSGALVALAFAGVVAAVTALAPAGGTLAAPTLEDQVHSIANGLMCPVCAGQTVADSDSELARQMRETIRQRLQKGERPEEIEAYFIAQFGEGVLAAPPPRGPGLLLWLSLPAALGAGLLAIGRLLRSRAAARPPAPPPPTLEEEREIERTLREIE